MWSDFIFKFRLLKTKVKNKIILAKNPFQKCGIEMRSSPFFAKMISALTE